MDMNGIVINAQTMIRLDKNDLDQWRPCNIEEQSELLQFMTWAEAIIR